MISVALLGGLVTAFVLFKIIYNIYFHPLRSYPGPWYAAGNILWSQYHTWNGDLPQLVLDLHKKYGPVVRIGPNELVYTDAQAWKDIYGHRNGFPENTKEPSRDLDPDPNHPSIITAKKEQHSKLRRLLSNAFSEKSMKEQEPIIKSYIDLLIERLHGLASQNDSKNIIDMVRWYNFTTFDIIGHLSFAESFGCLENSEYHPWIECISAAIKFTSMMSALNRVQKNIVPIMEKMIPESVRKLRLDLYRMTDELVQRRHKTEPSYTDFMTHLIGAEKTGKLSMTDIISQAPTIVVAGSETTATLLSGGTFYLLSNPHVYKRITSEIRTRFSSQSEINISSVNELPYFMAFFDEALRLYPPAASNLSRVTPPEGATIAGKWVPGNTVVGIHQYAQYRSEENFAEPEVFAPERFLDLDDPKWKNDRRDALQPFSFGPRNCIGRNLAYFEMRLIVAALVWNFDMELVPGQDNWLDQKIYFVWEKQPLMVKLAPAER